MAIVSQPYHANRTGHVHVPGHPEWDTGIQHELRDDGTTLCGVPRSHQQQLHGYPVTITQDGPGIVNCKQCARIS